MATPVERAPAAIAPQRRKAAAWTVIVQAARKAGF